MPREAILSITTTCMENMIYIMNKAFYLNMSWGQNMAYHTFKLLLEEETRQKICVTRLNTDERLT
jgi:hypothetical protein